jgi:hypothetical protein
LLDRQKELVEEAIPHAEEVSQQVLAELGQKEESLESQLRRLEAATRDSMAEKANVDALTLRLQALLDDYRQYQDAKKVEAREGDPPLKTATGICPTCNQEIKDSLLRQELAAVPMSIDDNMVFIRDQIDTFRRMLTDAKEVSDAKQKQVDALRRRIGEINDRVRALKRTLHSDGNAPSIAAVQEQVQIEHRAQGLSELEAQFAEYSDRFAELSKEWTEVLSKLKSLVNVGLSENDEVKLQVWQSSFVTQLRDYGFGSMPIDQLSLSRDSYKPSRLGYEVGLTSASDAIRMIWAYLIGMMATSRRFPTNHLGLLVFDEPRQQGTKLLSFDALLKSAAAISGKTQQIVFVTSEEKEKLETSLAGIECNLIRSEGRILRSVTS